MIRFYASSNGDVWDLISQEDGRESVRHTPNVSSGGLTSTIPPDAFLATGSGGPEHAALRELLSKRNVLASTDEHKASTALRHQTRYRYRRPVAFQPHRLLVRPREMPGLRIVEFSLHSQPASKIEWSQDVFGNLVATCTFESLAGELCFNATSVLEQSSPEWPIFPIHAEAHRYPFRYSADDRIDLGPMMVPNRSQLDTVSQWAHSFVAGETTDTLSLLKDINASIIGQISYRIRDEEGTQDPATTLSSKSGSCRDISALFIEMVRILGFGARAVSGYLSDQAAHEADTGSTHAWAEIYLPGAGWIAFDPTHQRIGSAHLIPVAIGRSNTQIMPVSGSYIGQPEDFIEMTVDVKSRQDVL